MEERLYYFLLANNVGKKNKIKNRELRKLFNINDDRTLREMIQNIRMNKDYKYVVGSESGKNGGFYICDTPDEIEETINNIKHRANQMLRMTHIIEWKRSLNDKC